MSRCAEVLKRFLHLELRSFLQRHKNSPLLFFYSSDCTPASTMEGWARDWEGLRVRRRGRQSVELLQHRLFCMNSAGESRVVLDEPRPLSDKTSWTHLEAYRTLCAQPRAAGHEGLCIEHFVWDRAVAAPTFRHVRQLHKATEEAMRRKSRSAAPDLMSLLSWQTTSACANHDIHNGLKWSIMSLTADVGVLRGAFICVESLRNSYSSLVQHVTKWVAGILTFEDWGDFPAQQYYTVVGLEPATIELAMTLQARYHQGRFLVSKRYEGCEEVLDMVVTLLLATWSFRKWTESRWLSMGPSCRIMLAALGFGLKPFVSWCLAQPGQSRYYLGGFEDYASPEVLRLVAVIATSSFVADAALTSVLEDDRLARSVDTLQSDMLEELAYISGIPDSIWAFLGEVVVIPGQLMKHQAMSAGLVSAGFIIWRMRFLYRPPWVWCRGDIMQNIADLVDEDPPEEETSHKIYVLARMGYAPELLKQGLKLLANSSFSSVLVEQAHKYSSVLLKMHSGYSEQTVRSRSLIASAAPLVAASAQDKRLSTIEKNISALERKRRNVKHIGGRQAYVKDLIAVGSNWRKVGRKVSKRFSTTVMRHHSGDWKALDGEAKQHFEARAKEVQIATEEQIDSKVDELRAERKLYLQRAAEETSDTLPPFRMSFAKLSDIQKLRLDGMYTDGSISHHDVKAGQQQSQRLGPPPDAIRSLLQRQELFEQPGDPCRPSWLPAIAASRSLFADSIFRFTNEHAGVAYAKFLFARQAQPVMAAFVRAVPLPSRGCYEPARVKSRQASDWLHSFDLDFSTWLFSDGDDFPDVWALDILLDTIVLSHDLVVSDGEWVPFAELAASLPKADSSSEPEKKPPRSTDLGKEKPVPEWFNLPWLLDHMHGDLGRPAPRSPVVGGHDGVDGDSLPDAPNEDHLPEDELDAAVDELYERRFFWQTNDEAGQSEDFRWALRGGRWLAQRTGQAYDSFRAYACGSSSSQWCAMVRLTPTATFATRLYTEQGAALLCRVWCHKMQFLYDVWREAQVGGDVLVAEVLGAYRPPPEAEQLEGMGSSPCARRLGEIMRLIPRHAYA